MSTNDIILLLIVLALVGAFPGWGYARGFGYGPFGILGIVLIVLLLMRII